MQTEQVSFVSNVDGTWLLRNAQDQYWIGGLFGWADSSYGPCGPQRFDLLSDAMGFAYSHGWFSHAKAPAREKRSRPRAPRRGRPGPKKKAPGAALIAELERFVSPKRTPVEDRAAASDIVLTLKYGADFVDAKAEGDREERAVLSVLRSLGEEGSDMLLLIEAADSRQRALMLAETYRIIVANVPLAALA